MLHPCMNLMMMMKIPDEDDSDDAYIEDGVVAPVEANGADDEDDFFV